jgi:DNA-binding response OmpR family regulator
MRDSIKQPERILVVEDNVSMLLLIQKAIFNVRPKAEIFSAVSLEEAFTILIKNANIEEKNPYELIIADIFLEGNKTGLDLWRVLRGTYPTIPIVVITSLEEEKVMSTLLDHEKNAMIYFKKPFMISELQAKIQEVLSQGPRTDIEDPSAGYKPDKSLVSTDEQLEHMAHMVMLKLSLDWLIKQNWVDTPYGGQNPVQDILYQARFLTEKFWEEFFFKNDMDLAVKERKIQEHIMQLSELTPELKQFFQDRLGTMEEFFHHGKPRFAGTEHSKKF